MQQPGEAKQMLGDAMPMKSATIIESMQCHHLRKTARLK